MKIGVCLEVEIPDRELSVNSIERGIAEAAGRFPSAAWGALVRAVEARAREAYPPGRLRVKSVEDRTLWTVSGPVTFRRRRFEDPAEPRSFLLFDGRVGLEPWRRSTEAADRCFAETAAEMPYRVAARALARGWGEGPGPMTVWGATQRVGRALRAEKEALRRRIFREHLLPGWERPPPEFVAVEADSTFLPAWREKGRHWEVFVGISYTGKEVCSGRRRLKDRVLCTSLQRPARFGQELFASAQVAHNVAAAEVGLYLSDGARELRGIQEEHFPQLTRQADRAHATRRVQEAYGAERRGRANEVLGALYGEARLAACRGLRRDARRLPGRAERLLEAAGYLEGLGEDLYGVKRLRESGAPVPEHMEGSGGIERAIGVTLTQRMKRRGMSWTHRGAENLLAVREELLDRLAAS